VVHSSLFLFIKWDVLQNQKLLLYNF